MLPLTHPAARLHIDAFLDSHGSHGSCPAHLASLSLQDMHTWVGCVDVCEWGGEGVAGDGKGQLACSLSLLLLLHCSAELGMLPHHKRWVDNCRLQYSKAAGWEYRSAALGPL